MSDIIDNAQDAADMLLRASLSVRRTDMMRAVGFCYSCGEECLGVFCDADCSTDFTRVSEARKRNG